MTQYNFNRKYELVINSPINLGSPQKDHKDTPLENDSTDFAASENYTVIYSNSIKITDLQIEVDIKNNSKSAGSKGNQSTIKIYNLAPETRAIVEAPNNTVLLNAGYEDEGNDLPIIFVGQVLETFTEKDGNDVITTLTCQDGGTPKNAVRISFSVEKGASYEDVFRRLLDIWKRNGLAVGEVVLDKSPDQAPTADLPPSQTYLDKPYNYTGFLRDAMDDLAKDFNLTWQMVDGTVHVFPKYYGGFVEVTELTYDQIISIEDSQEALTSTSNNPDKKGLTVKCLLDGRIKNTKQLKITGGDKAGSYRINSVEFKLSYEGQDWYTIIDCSSL